MGCDIHIYKEKKVDGVWVTAEKWEEKYGELNVPYDKRINIGRSYQAFGILSAGVRGYLFPYSVPARGLPETVCAEVKARSDYWGCDAHSHSFLTLEELRQLKDDINTRMMRVSGMKDSEELKSLRASIASGATDWDLLYPFCQGTNSPNYEYFEVDVPVSFKVGYAFDEIIASLELIGTEESRIVFWFDN